MKSKPKSTTQSKPAELYYGILPDEESFVGPLALEELVSEIRNCYGANAVEQSIIFPASAGKKVRQTITLV